MCWCGLVLELLHETRCLGILQRLAERFVRWMSEVAFSPAEHMTNFDEGSDGSCLSQELSSTRRETAFGATFRIPYHACTSRSSTRKVPSYVAFILNFISGRTARCRHDESGTGFQSSNFAPRVDEQATAGPVLGGWYPLIDADGRIDRWNSYWFSFQILPEAYP